MPKKKDNNKDTQQQRETKKKERKKITDERVKYSMGLFVVFFAIYLSLAFISYLFTWKADQSFQWDKVISDASVQVQNWSGKTGAELANLFMDNWFGLPSFIIPLILFVIGLRMLGMKIKDQGRWIRISLVAMILLSITFGYLWGNLNGFLGSGPGGAHGYFVSTWLNAFIGRTGTAFLLIIAFSVFIFFSWENSLYRVKSFFRKFFAKPGKKYPEIGQGEATSPEGQETEEGKEERHTGQDDDQPTVQGNAQQEKNEEGADIDFEYIERPENKDQEQTMPGQEKNGPGKGQEENELELTIEQRQQQGNEEEEASGEKIKDFDPTLELPNYKHPDVDLLEDHKSEDISVTKEELIANKNKIVETLANYNIQINKIKATIGPTVTLYEIVPAPGIRISKIKNLEDDIALSLAALGIRIIAPIPGKGTIGIEVPNQNPEIVSMKSVISSQKFQENNYDLAIGIGKTVSNDPYVFDLARMPHLLVAGATGQGKSVGLNAILASLLYKKHPAQIKFVLIDPKKVELTLFSKIENYFLAKLPDAEEAIITDTQKVINTLNSLTIEMDERYDLLKSAHVRNLKEYNAKFIKRRLNPEKGHRYLPYIVVVIDEFADLIMTAGKEVEMPLARLAQLARAVGIHLIIATQRPTTNIITGVIKANFPARIAFRVTSMIDSRTILDSPGANQLIGRGDMLLSSGSDMVRIQCAFIDTPEIEKITDHISQQQGYPTPMLLPEYVNEGTEETAEVDLKKRDGLFEEAARLLVIHQQGSTSLIQRKFSIGYNRAGRIIDQLEAAGIVGPFEGSKAREVLIPDEYSLEQIFDKLNNL